MIQGFEKETGKLTDQELLHVAIIVKILRFHSGKEKAVTSDRLADHAMHTDGVNLGTGARVRKMINHIRTTGMIPNLAASSKGYYIEQDMRELKIYAQSLRDRAASIVAVARVLEDHIKDKGQEEALKSQTNLF